MILVVIGSRIRSGAERVSVWPHVGREAWTRRLGRVKALRGVCRISNCWRRGCSVPWLGGWSGCACHPKPWPPRRPVWYRSQSSWWHEPDRVVLVAKGASPARAHQTRPRLRAAAASSAPPAAAYSMHAPCARWCLQGVHVERVDGRLHALHAARVGRGAGLRLGGRHSGDRAARARGALVRYARAYAAQLGRCSAEREHDGRARVAD